MQFIGVEDKIEQLSRLWSKIMLTVSCDGVKINFEKGEAFRVFKEGNEIKVSYVNHTQLYRSLLLAAELIEEGKDGEICEKEQFERRGVMLDMSRAGVMTLDAVKEYIEYMALCGLNALMLYMEDVYEVDGLPYFGYMRGRYTKEDLKELDEYGIKYGVELIPCIQTLAHFDQYLPWKEADGLSDTATVIMPGDPASMEFIDKLLATVSECFTTRRIHIGMDEAWGMGGGHYLKKYGYQDGTKIFCDHLIKVKALTDKYNLEPMIWSDMYFRLASPKDSYYDKDAVIEDYVKDLLPEGVSLTYWDYYHTDEDEYRDMVIKHKQLTDKVVFAGGIWIWAGLLPDYKHTFISTNAGLNVCKEHGIKDVYATMWGDDGCETDVRFSLPGCVLYGEHSYNENFNQQELDKKLKLLFGFVTSDIEAISDALYPLKASEKSKISIKQIVYNDIICGVADYDMSDEALLEIYGKLNDKYAKLAENEGPLKEHMEYVAVMCKLAYDKVNTLIKLNKGYSGDKVLLREVADKLLPGLCEDFNELKKIHYSLWHGSYRPQGFEIVDGRYGIKMERIRTAIMRINDYLDGKISSLPELEEKRIPFVGQRGIGGWHSGVASAFMPKGY